MNNFHKVVWYEGMKLDPHHFQQMDRYLNYSLNKRITSVNDNYWGISNIQIDNATLADGSFGLIECSGVMPDGILFNIPENDILPKSRNFENIFDVTGDRLEVFLGIPLEQITGNNCLLDDSPKNRLTRYTFQTIELVDDNVGANLRPIGIARPNYQIKFSDEILDEFSVIKIGEIIRSSDGKYMMDADYIATCLSISTSDSLMSYIREILAGLVAKSKELQNQLNPYKKEITFTDIEILMLLQIINANIPLVKQYYQAPNKHPEIIYALLLSLGGKLSSIQTADDISAIDFQNYDHKNLTKIFQNIYQHIISLLKEEKVVEQLEVEIPLQKQGDSMYVGKLSEEEINSQLFLLVSSSLPEKKIITEFSANIKIAAQEEILAVHQAGLQAVTIDYVSRPPTGLSTEHELHYFKIQKEGRFWNKIVEKQSIAFFLAVGFTEVNLKLISFNRK